MKNILFNKKNYYPPKIEVSLINLEDSILSCSVCIVPESATDDILIKDYTVETEIENLNF